MTDPVKKPAHYTAHPSGVECIEIVQHFNFNRGNAIKYIWRAGLKGDAAVDLRKAREYIDFELKLLENQKPPVEAESLLDSDVVPWAPNRDEIKSFGQVVATADNKFLVHLFTARPKTTVWVWYEGGGRFGDGWRCANPRVAQKLVDELKRESPSGNLWAGWGWS